MSYEQAISGGIIIPALFLAALGIILICSPLREKAVKKNKFAFICVGIFLILAAIAVIILSLCGLGKYAVSVCAIALALLLFAMGIFGIICICAEADSGKKANIGIGSVVFLLVIATVIMLFGITTVLP